MQCECESEVDRYNGEYMIIMYVDVDNLNCGLPFPFLIFIVKIEKPASFYV